MIQGRRFTQREEEGEEEEAGYNLIPRRLDFFDIISAWTNRLLSQVNLYRIYIYQHGMEDPMISLFLYQVRVVFHTLSDLILLLFFFFFFSLFSRQDFF